MYPLPIEVAIAQSSSPLSLQHQGNCFSEIGQNYISTCPFHDDFLSSEHQAACDRPWGLWHETCLAVGWPVSGLCLR